MNDLVADRVLDRVRSVDSERVFESACVPVPDAVCSDERESLLLGDGVGGGVIVSVADCCAENVFDADGVAVSRRITTLYAFSPV